MRGMRRCQRACPPHELVEHHSARVDQVRIIVERLPLCHHTDKCLEPDVHREAERSHSQLDGCEPQMFDRPRRPDAAVTNVTNRLVFPLFHRVVQSVLQNCRRPVSVLGSAYDEAVELCDLLSPTLSERMRKDASAEDGRRRLGEKWQWPIAQIERFQLEVRSSGSSLLDPLHRVVSETVGARATDDECDPHHIFIQHDGSHFAAASMTRATSLGCDRNGTWLALISVVVASMRFA